ncbi:MAG: AI-2E family transporter [Firmicutes bacterium]|nr:AI-2E family transporter [Bacillota bacterium]
MFKNKVNFKLVNIAIVVLIVFLLYQTGHLWMGITDKILQICLPFLFAFAMAYAVQPFLQKMIDKKIPKWLGIIIIIFVILSLASLVIYLITTVMISQMTSLFNNIIQFINSLGQTSFDFNLVGLETSLTDTFRTILTNLGTYVSDGAINIIDSSLGVISTIFIVFAAFIYFLIDMDKIREEIKFFFSKKSKKTFNYVRTLDHQMKNYLNGMVQVIIITLVEYTLVYTIIGHPNAILLGFLAAVANLIPYFGGIAVNIIAAITAVVVSPGLLFRTIIAFAILSAIDSYVINPTVYGKTNSIHPLVTIMALFAGGILFGILGVFISFPLAIIVVTTHKYYKEDITRNIKKVRNND